VRRSILSAVVLTSVFAFALTASGASTPADRLAYLIGTWNCSIKLAATAGNAGGISQGVWTFTKSQAGAVHAHWAGPGYEADDYYGYNVKTKTYWIVGIDTQGVVGSQTSKDDITFTGSFTAGGVSSPERDIITRPTASRFHDLSETEAKGVWAKAADTECTKT